MPRQQPLIISDSTKAPAPICDRHELIGHHRYYGSSAIDGERLAESRHGPRPLAANVRAF